MKYDHHLTMHDLPEDDRPYEKLLHMGAAALSDAELMAVIIRSGSRKESALALTQRLIRTLDEQSAGPVFLRDSSVEELTALPGIGRVKALQLKAAIELGNRAGRTARLSARRLIKRPEDVLGFLEKDMIALPREELRIVLLDARNRIIRICRIGEGGLTAAVIHPRDLFREAVKANAASLILVHNHPSGDATPSSEDIETTRKMCEIGEMMGIRVMDHLVVASSGSVSFRQKGLL
ncbi:MAG: DNA repair protein RadC [Bacillota bacterium]|nr:DNA repair protein RadC [Bacillota bacterium]